ncbi:MAG: DUF1800 domain-containing protein [Cyanobacteria bacterium J083]|nr:MAG: DUF1800 domain-containing protein [Cyanobacteria bacterium J083]
MKLLSFSRSIYLCLCIFILVLGIFLFNASQNKSTATEIEIFHLLNRTTLGITQSDIEQVKSQGARKYIKAQLNPESTPESDELLEKLAKIDHSVVDPAILYQKYRQTKSLSNLEKKQRREKLRQLTQAAVQAHLLRAIASRHQLQEVMVNFWLNHFNVFIDKNLGTKLWMDDYEQTIRQYALTNFRDLLGATAHHPAMLFYLDNWQSSDPNSPGARGKFKGLNENYARELMELHTLGVNGGYNQADVVNLARILTGWGVDLKGQNSEHGFKFYPNRHDYQAKVFLGNSIPASGLEEGEIALDLLAFHPSTAKHLSYKLAQYFVADEPPPSLVKNLAKTFLASQGDIKTVLKTLLASPEFNAKEHYGKQFKTPYEYVVALIRTSQITKPNLSVAIRMIKRLGMPIYGSKTPDGYSHSQNSWLSPEAMLQRVSLATMIAQGVLSRPRQPVEARQLKKTLEPYFSAHSRQIIETSRANLRSALILGSPEMMYR